MSTLRHAAVFCAAIVAIPACAQTAAPAAAGSKTVLQQADFPDPGYVTRVTRSVLPAGVRAALHQHPGIESGYIVRGGGVVHVAGMPERRLGPGDSIVVPPDTPHWFANDGEATEIVATYVLERGKPAMQKLDQDAAAPGNGPVGTYAPGLKDGNKAVKVLQSAAFPGLQHYTRIVRAEVPPGGRAPLHTHAGIEISYLLSGSATLWVAGQAERKLQAGDSFQIPAGAAHTIVNGNAATVLLSTYVLEAGKPVMQVVQ